MKMKIVAHRGFAGKYPENTMAAMQAAVDQGVSYLELDVQMTADQVPVLFHDETLERTAGVEGNLLDMPWAELASVNASEAQRLGDGFSDEPIPTLEQFVTWLASKPEVHTFVEIKDESLDRVGYEVMLSKIVPICEKARDQITIIGYDLNFLANAREHGFERIGWVLTKYNEQEKIQAAHHQPDYIICNYKKVDSDLWQGPWQWMFYEITSADLAREWIAKGAVFIETMEVEQLINGLQPEEWRD